MIAFLILCALALVWLLSGRNDGDSHNPFHE